MILYHSTTRILLNWKMMMESNLQKTPQELSITKGKTIVAFIIVYRILAEIFSAMLKLLTHLTQVMLPQGLS